MSLEYLLTVAVLDLIPNWYEATCGPFVYDLTVGDYRRPFCTHRGLTPRLGRLRDLANSRFPNWQRTFPGDIPPSLFTMVQESFVYQWLKMSSKDVDWLGVLNYAENLLRRTYENLPIVRNLIICEGTGSTHIADPRCQKFFDPLASSPRTVIRVDRQLRFLGYKQVCYDNLKDAKSYQFYPSFLHPIAQTLQPGEYSVHLTTKGDLVFLDSAGLLAAKRKGRWKVYDAQTFKNSIVDILDDYWVGCNLFQLTFDLSFRRHGALLVYDPDHNLLSHVVNVESIVAGSSATPGVPQATLSPLLSSIKLSASDAATIPTLILHELASIDGALIFDRDRILAVGAVIEPHNAASGQIGARTTAALSAYRWGAHPIKVSSDGEVTLLFSSRGSEGESCDARIDFL